MNEFKQAPAFDFYPERWTHGTRHMSKIERCDYIDLLCHQWTEDGIIDDLEMISRILGYKKPEQIPRAVMAKFPKAEDGKRRNKRLETERRKQKERFEKKSLGASKTNQKRWGNKSLSDQLAIPESVANGSPPPTSDLRPFRTAISTPATGLPDSVEQAVSMAEMAGVPADYAETIFLEHEGSTWEDGQGRPINNFSSYIKARYTNRTNKLAREERRYSNRSNGATPNGTPTANTVYQVQQQIDAINESITELDASVPGAWGELSPAKKVERRKLVERRTELKRKLSGLEETT